VPSDYKYHATRRRKRKPVSPWLGLLAGLLIGLFIAFLAYLKLLAPQAPRDVQTGAPAALEPTPESATEKAQPEPAVPAPPAPRFDFYTILPEMEVVVPEEEIQASTAKPPPPVVDKTATAEKKSAAPQEIYYLQAGSFRGAVQADRFKAKLALMGFETDIQTITINNRDTFHRVRVGPFNSLAALQNARKRLSQEGIDTRTVRIKGG
jgi:cell division protein FtsN